MLHPSTKKLIDKLGEMTRKQRVSWIEGENGTIVHDTEGYRVVLTPEPHGVVLTDALGREIETCSPEEIADEKDAAGRPYPLFVRELFHDAHRYARGTEKAIRTLLAGLEASEDEPETVSAAPAPEPEPEPETVTDETTSFDGEGAITAAVATLADQINNTAPMAGPEVATAAPEPEFIADAEPEFVAEPEAMAAPDPEPVMTAPEPEPQPEPAPEPAPLPAAYAEVDTGPAEEIEEEAEPAMPEETMEEAAALAAPENEPEAAFEAPAETWAAPEPEPEPQPEPVAAVPEPVAEQEVQPAPASDEPTTPNPMQQRFSLSGIPYGVGFAGTQPVAAPPEKPAEPAPAEPRTLIIDGTEDLPETVPGVAEEESFAAAPAPHRETGEEDGTPVIPRRFNPWN